MPDKFQIGDYWLGQRSGSEQWYRCWYEQSKGGRRGRTKRASLGTADFQEAQLRLAQWVITQSQPRNQPHDEALVEEILIVYWEKHGQFTAGAEATRYCLDKWSTYFAQATLSEVTLDNQKKFLGWLTDNGASLGYCQRVFTIGRAAINYAWKNGRIAHAPYVMTPQAPEPESRVLNRDEVGALFKAIESEHGFMYFILAFNTAARETTILDLQPFQVDKERRLINLNPAGRVQTKKRRPTIPITDTLWPWVQDSTAEYFVNWYGRKIKSVRKLIADTSKRAGIGKIGSRTIRHTVATELRSAGVPMWEVEGFLGHKMPSTSERYAQYAPDYLSHATAAIDEYLRASCAPVIEGAKKEYLINA